MAMSKKTRTKNRPEITYEKKSKGLPKEYAKLREDIITTPVYEFHQDAILSEYPALTKKESSEHGFQKDAEPDEEYIDCPEMETNYIETGEGPSFISSIGDSPPQSFVDLARQKIAEEFNDNDDSAMIHKIMNVLNDWEDKRKDFLQMQPEVRDWLEITFCDMLEAEIKRGSQPRDIEPDIFFWISGSDVFYKVNDKPFHGITLMNIPSEIDKDEEQAKWKEEIKKAENFLEIVIYRNKKLAEIAKKISEHQKDFFLSFNLEDAIKQLKPLRLDEVGKKSTISRLIQNKYVQTPLGNFPLALFFPGKISVKALDILRNVKNFWSDIRKNPNQLLPSAKEQNIILKFFGIDNFTPDTIKKTLWPEVELKGEKGRYTTPTTLLQKLLEKLGKSVSESDIKRMMNELSKEKPKKQKPLKKNERTAT